ncbi:MAG: hypothetical protein E6G58_03595 [Actinobacteria bacterium]|nr:MAG: hypothetical protein E6G58_03595 [Actinomycetota bacterium]
MREDVNDLLDRAVGWYRPRTAPDPASIAGIAGKRRRRRRLGAIAVSTVITLGSLVLLIGTLKPGGSQPPVGSGTPSGTEIPASAGQVIGFHGVDVTVPASWKINDMTCGTPQSDTVIRDEGATTTCLIPRLPGISSLELVDNPQYWQPKMQSVRTLTNPHGVRLDRGTVPDRPGTAIYVPDVRVLMFFDTATDAETNAIIDSIQLADTDPNGCAMRETELDPPTSYQPGASMKDVLIPGSPSAIAICHYVDNWLASSATVTDQEMTNLISVADGLPEGFVRAPPSTYDPSLCNEPSSSGGELGSGFILWVSESGGDARLPLWAHVGFCGHLGITNGARDGQLTPDLAAALNEPLHAGYDVPGRLIPDPPSH